MLAVKISTFRSAGGANIFAKQAFREKQRQTYPEPLGAFGL
jgi:hypothetical protein